MSDSMPHLAGESLEALAVGEAADTNAAEHLKICAQCRAELAAMTRENALFATELAGLNPQEPVMNKAVISNTPELAPPSHKPLVFYAAAASVMLVSALALIYSGNQKRDAKAAAVNVHDPAPRQHIPAEDAKGEKDGKGEVPENSKPKEGEAVYEGKTAAQWLAKVKENAIDSTLTSEALHALTQLGLDALPQAIELSRTEGKTQLGQGLLDTMDINKDDLPRLKELLKSDDFATRRASIQLMGRLAVEKAPELAGAIRDAIIPALRDRDRAVAEAARKVLLATGSGGPDDDEQQHEAEDRAKRAILTDEIEMLTKKIEARSDAITNEQRLDWRKKREQDIEELNRLSKPVSPPPATRRS